MRSNDYFLVVLLATGRLEYNLSVWKTWGFVTDPLERAICSSVKTEHYTHM